MMGDREALAELFRVGAVLSTGSEYPTHGPAEIVQVALATWQGDQTFVAHPCQVIQARDNALVVTERGLNVAPRDLNGTWRYAVVH